MQRDFIDLNICFSSTRPQLVSEEAVPVERYGVSYTRRLIDGDESLSEPLDGFIAFANFASVMNDT